MRLFIVGFFSVGLFVLPQCYTICLSRVTTALSKSLPNTHTSLCWSIHYAYHPYGMRLAEIKTTFCGDKEILKQCQQQIISAAALHWDPFTQLHVTDRTETLKINNGKPLACLTLVLKEIWAGTNETKWYCQTSKGMRLYCCYWHSPLWGEKSESHFKLQKPPSIQLLTPC